jgi:hypothetical protein
MAEVKKLKSWNLTNKVMSEQEIDAILLDQSDISRPLRVEEKKWPAGWGQNFISNRDEKVILVYWDKELYSSYAEDPLILRLLSHSPRASHFFDLTSPLGWALVYTDSLAHANQKDDGNFEENTWVINQIQSDIFTDFRHIMKEVQEREQGKEIDLMNPQQGKITTEELDIRLNANNRSGYINILRQPEYSEILNNLLSNPNQITELPEAITEEEANIAIAENIENLTRLRDQGILDLEGKEQLRDLSLAQLKYIEDKLGWLINNWPNIVFQNVWTQAKKHGVKHLYMNSSDTVYGGLSNSAKKIFYEDYPRNWGFEKVVTDELRNKGEERFWYRKADKNDINKNNWYRIASNVV